MDRGAWQAAVHGFAKSDTTKMTEHVISSDSGIKECFMKILPDPNKSESLFYFLDLENIFLTVSQLALHKLGWKIALVSSVS